MTYCVTPGCFHPQNSDDAELCQSCGNKLLLKERYLPIKPISQGGFGKTFLAKDTHIPSQPECVIKQLYFSNSDPATYRKVVSLFKEEAIRLDTLGKHPQIPQLFAYFEQQRNLYLVQEFIQGKTLYDEFQYVGDFQESHIWELLQDLLPVLQFIHDNRVIHRDIKPQNIMKRTSDNHLVLIDFGVSKVFSESNLMQTATIIGTMEYMSPEQSKGKVFPGSDIYSLGVTCLYLITGEKPLNMFDIREDQWNWRKYVPSEVKISDRLARIIDKMILPSLKNRYQNTAEVLEDINYKQKAIVINKKPDLGSLKSEVGVNYTKLEKLLSAQKWKEADYETWNVMCQVMNKHSGGYLFPSDLGKFPLNDLLIIDLLWQKYSNKRFGFTIQKQIWEKVGKEYNLFCQNVEWTVYQPYIPDDKIQFNLKAPLGHLPSRKWIGGSEWWRHAEAMAQRLDDV
jgi:serine/threonine protein kinase